MLAPRVSETFKGLRANYMNFREMTSMPEFDSAAETALTVCRAESGYRKTKRGKS